MLPKQYRLQVRAVIPPHDCDSSSKCRSVPCDNQCLPACLQQRFRKTRRQCSTIDGQTSGRSRRSTMGRDCTQTRPTPDHRDEWDKRLAIRATKADHRLAGNYTNITNTTAPAACGVTCGSRACGRSCPAQVAGDGMMDVMGACINHNHTDHLRVRACLLAACPLIT